MPVGGKHRALFIRKLDGSGRHARNRAVSVSIRVGTFVQELDPFSRQTRCESRRLKGPDDWVDRIPVAEVLIVVQVRIDRSLDLPVELSAALAF